MASLEALAAVHARHGHIQEVILQNFVPHPRYYGREVAEIADAATARVLAQRGRARAELTPALPEWACEVTIEDMKSADRARARADAGRRHPGPAEPRRLVAGARRGRRDRPRRPLGERRPHLARSTPSRARTRCESACRRTGVALTERLCAYPRYIDSEWISQGVLDVIKQRYWSFIPRRGSGRREPPFAIRSGLVGPAVAKARDGGVAERARS